MRTWLAPALAVAAIAIACGDDRVVPPPLPEVTDPIPLVDPTIGTGGIGFSYGSSFVGAAVPHGLIKLGPDTSGPFGTVAFQHFSGYYADDDVIERFSHLHLHGAGVADFGTLAVMPTQSFQPTRRRADDYRASFAKADEVARPGRYAVRLANGIAVELTATARAGHHVYRFPSAGGTLVLDLAAALDSEVEDAELTVDAATQTVRGRLRHRGGMTGSYGGYDLYFTARARTPWTAATVWSESAAPGPGPSATGTGVGAALTFADATVELQVGVSLVDAAGADRNLAAELPAWDADATWAAAEDAWRARLGVVAITGGTPAERRIFYASLYHAFLMPTVIGDVDGRYRLAGMATPTMADGWTPMSDLSLWDTYRTVHPLYAWLAPTSARDTTGSLAAFAAIGGCPRWPIAIGESGTMLGASCDIVVADAVARGVPEHAERLWPLLRAAALDATAPPTGRGGRDQVEAYMRHGYVPAEIGRSVSHTTEYAHADFALANLAEHQGDSTTAAALRARSRGWRALYDPAVGFLRARRADGTFPPGPFDPTELSEDYAEANAWHSLWMTAIHDADGLAELLGGRAAAIAKLEEFFDRAALDLATADPSAAYFPRPYYWHGNEPDLNAAYVFAQLGRPDLTQVWTRWIREQLYADTPDGLAGNDDGGTLGAWYVFTALGLYPVAGSDGFVIGAPSFERARITVDGHELIIDAPGASAERRYVAAVALDGVPVTAPRLTQGELRQARTLTFTMTDEPTTWGQ
ncbi:MAG: GH92 family glycosyl hydrolase [Kofleriaceae bacterium]|jgi:predicted alpha-1,2-mannosidase|nr:GH92 family glycosyl hydrolase [Kofleriaceae bacterium]MBP9167571.1 GH92 family glycosyl hydrolase [Kofleriaceae bacterium]MBP9856653.1 GH92 family glycosyl hydrolase [Kofleriaceae bacterium]